MYEVSVSGQFMFCWVVSSEVDRCACISRFSINFYFQFFLFPDNCQIKKIHAFFFIIYWFEPFSLHTDLFSCLKMLYSVVFLLIQNYDVIYISSVIYNCFCFDLMLSMYIWFSLSKVLITCIT